MKNPFYNKDKKINSQKNKNIFKNVDLAEKM